jgi:DNA-binding MarR family transcriptional regulator
MNLEQALNRKGKFRNENHKAVVNTHFSGLWVQEKMSGYLKPYNLSNPQYNIIRILDRAGTPLSTLQIRHRMMDKMSDTSRIVDRLVAKKLVKKTISKKDKRLVDVVLSAKGKALVKTLETEVDPKVDELTGLLTPAEANLLNNLLDKMRG